MIREAVVLFLRAFFLGIFVSMGKAIDFHSFIVISLTG